MVPTNMTLIEGDQGEVAIAEDKLRDTRFAFAIKRQPDLMPCLCTHCPSPAHDEFDTVASLCCSLLLGP